MKKYWDKLIYALLLVLGALLYRQTKKTESAESELAKEKANGEIKANEAERVATREHADALVAEYEKLKREDG